jgi:hypothetical protein
VSETLQRMELDSLKQRPGGKWLVLGVAWRLVMAAVLFTLCWFAVTSCRGEARIPEGSFQVSRCSHDWAQPSGEYTCVGTLRTAPGGRVLTKWATMYDYKQRVGATITVRYNSRFDVDSDASKATWLARRDGLIAVSFGVGGLLALVNVVRRIRPDLAWLRPETKQWGRLAGTGGVIIGFCAVASLVSALIAF